MLKKMEAVRYLHSVAPGTIPRKSKLDRVGSPTYIFGWQIVNGSQDFEFTGNTNKYYVSVCILQNAHLFIYIVH